VGVVLFTAVMAGVSGCNTNPHAPDIAAPAGQPAPPGDQHHGKGHQGIQLPSTLTVAYDHTPYIQDTIHHQVLWAASQAVKAEFEATYQKTSAATPDLARLWTGSGYSAAYVWAQSWIAQKIQPVGRVVISNTSVDNLTSTQATVAYCQDMTMVKRGVVKTNQFEKGTVQAVGTNSDRVRLTLKPSGPGGTWQVSAIATEKSSPQCAPLSKSHKGQH
jgi:hypothetical protein